MAASYGSEGIPYASASNVHRGEAARAPWRTRLLGRYFYFFMSLLIAAVVVYGFSRTVGKGLIHPDIPRPFVLHLHAAVFSGWVLFFILQSTLIVIGKVQYHQISGWFGAVLGIAVIVVGVRTAVTMARFNIQHYHSRFAALTLIISFYDMAAFGVAFVLAILWRRTPETHRRLMLVATGALTAAAFGRFPIPPHIRPSIFFYSCVDLLILVAAARDLIVNARVHRVYLVALPAFVACQSMVIYTIYHHLPAWLRIAHAIVD